jgi:tRNA pseudouridine38-40 synthase
MRNVRFVIRYDGTAFAGWQTQPGERTVQETLEKAISQVTQQERVRLNPSGRTDGGVHALGQVANCYLKTRHSPEVLVKAVNAHLTTDLCVRFADDVPQSFCANKDAIRKTYRYLIYDGRPQDPFSLKFAHHCRKLLNAELMHDAAQALLGRHDFRSFETDWPNRLSSVRTISHISVTRRGEYLWLDVEADGFLYNMVRTIAGTMLKVGRGDWPPSQIPEVLLAQDRRAAGPTAPPEGLFLLKVTYPGKLALPEEQEILFFSGAKGPELQDELLRRDGELEANSELGQDWETIRSSIERKQ